MPTRRVAADLDLLGFGLLNARVHPVSSDPTGLGVGDTGRIIINTTSGRLKVWSGTAWIDLLDRANHVSTQLANTISNFAAAVQALQWASMAAPTAPVSMGGQRITTVADPTAATDGANKQYVDNALAGLSNGLVLKGSVRVATATNISIASAPATADGITLANGDIILLTGQTTPSQNGPRVFTAAGSPLNRAPNWDATAEAVLGSFWIVREGTYADQIAVLTNDTPITLDTTALTFVFRGASSSAYTAGNGLSLTGADFNVGAGTGITVGADTVGIDTTVVGRKVTGTIPVTTGGVFVVAGSNVTVNHQLGNLATDIRVVYGSAGAVPGAPVDVDYNNTDPNNSLIALPGAPTANQYVLSAIG